MERLPIKTAFRTKVKGLEVRNTESGDLYTMGDVQPDSVVLVDVDGNELEVNNDDFDAEYALC